MHNGDDTDFYLRKGFKVLAVEAAPQHVERANARFRAAIEADRLTILNVAVADFEGEIEFFLSEEDGWASTRADMADKGLGFGQQRIVVPCTTLDKILVGYPTPYFIKIDIEGRDRDCIESLRRLPEKPKFVSFEADLADPGQATAMLSMLASYGYKRFKLVNQAFHSILRMPNPPLEGRYEGYTTPSRRMADYLLAGTAGLAVPVPEGDWRRVAFPCQPRGGTLPATTAADVAGQ